MATTTWTDAHKREGRRVLLHLASVYCSLDAEDSERLCLRLAGQKKTTASRDAFKAALKQATGYDHAVSRWLRRVCARAEGREVVEVETRYRVAFTNNGGERVHAWPAALGGPQNDRAGAREVVRTSVERGLKDARVLRWTRTRRRLTPAKNPGGS